MKRRIGILTSGGDCPGLNAAIRGAVKAVYQRMPEAEIIGIVNGYYGLVNKEYKLMHPSDFSGIITRGGTILGTSRVPYKTIQAVGDDQVDKVGQMKQTYGSLKLDCLLTLGGNGTHKTANLLSQNGLDVIALPKTIDNDIFGTEETFGFNTAVEIGTEVIDRLHTTAASHSRVMVIEIMGNKSGWLTLYAGLAGGADVIILPEIPYSMDKICEAIVKRTENGSVFSIVAVAEGAVSAEEFKMKKKERLSKRKDAGHLNVGSALAEGIQKNTGIETRATVPGYYLRGGTPTSYDRTLSTRFGVHAASMIFEGRYGVTVAMADGKITHNNLSDIAGKPRPVPLSHNVVATARSVGIAFGD